MRNLSGNKLGNMVDLYFCLGRKINILLRYWYLFLFGVMVYILRFVLLMSKEFIFFLLLDKVYYGLSSYL